MSSHPTVDFAWLFLAWFSKQCVVGREFHRPIKLLLLYTTWLKLLARWNINLAFFFGKCNLLSWLLGHCISCREL